MSTYTHPASRASEPDQTTTIRHPAQNAVPFTISTHVTPPFASSPQPPTNPNYGRFNMHIQNGSGSWTQSHTPPDLQHQNPPQSAAQNIYTTSQPSPSSFNQTLPPSQSLFSQLQETNSNQAEQITSLRIRVAVLENELSHAKKKKTAVERSLGIVIESLTRFHNTNPIPNSRPGGSTALGADRGEARADVKGLEKEIERLRKENRGLRQQAKEQWQSFLSHSHSTGRDDHEAEHVHFRPGTPVQRSSSSIDKGKGKGKGRFQDSFENGVLQALEPETLIGSWGNPAFDSSFEAVGPSSHKFNDSFGSGGSTTVPNTPLLNATEFDVSFADVGLHSLEENMEMDSDGFPPALSFESGKGRTVNDDVQNGVEEEKDINGQLEEQRAAMVKFNNVPKPGVLKVGFEVEGSKRGEEYDFTSSSSFKAPNYPRNHSMRDYNRFGAPTGPRAMIGEGTSFENPKDRSFDTTLRKEKEERDGAVEIHMRACSGRDMRFPDFFRYGIQYVPSASDSNYLRTVMITNLPLNTELRDVLARVRGGEVLSASLLDTGKLMGSLSARVVFRHEAAAEEYALYAKEHPILFGDEEKQAEVTLIETPTYPLNPGASTRLQAHQQTRCLSLPNFPTTFSLNSLERNLSCGNGMRAEMLVEIWIDEAGTLHLQFSSVEEAGKAFGILGAWQMYRGLEVRFEEDPCAGPVEELLEPVKPRPPMLPKNWAAIEKASEERRARSVGVGAELIENQRKIFASFEGKNDEVVREVEGMQRKRLAALSTPKVEIPSFRGKEISGASWADEVIEEAESGDTLLSSPTSTAPNPPPNSPIHNSATLANGREEGKHAQSIDEKINAIMVENVNEMMFQGSSEWWTDSGLRKPPVGLAGSKYATLVPAFSDLSERKRVAGRRSSDVHCQDQDPASNHLTHDSTSTSTTNLNPEPETHLHLLQEVAKSNPSNISTSSSSSPLSPSTSHHETALQRLLVLDNHAPIPVSFLSSSNSRVTNNSNTSNNRLNTSPPRTNLQDLLTSSSSSSSTTSSPPKHHPRHSLSDPNPSKANPENEEEIGSEGVIRMPRGPDEHGFKGFSHSNCTNLLAKHYDSLEAETDEVNLRMRSDELAVHDDLSSISANSESVNGKEKGRLNPDEILLDLDLDCVPDIAGGALAKGMGSERLEEGIST